MKRFLSKKVIVGAVTSAAVIGISSAAFAYFTASGAGTGTASVGTSTAWGVSAASATGGPLTPGGPTESIVYTITNNSSGKQAITSLTASLPTPASGTGAGNVESGGSPTTGGCLASWFTATAGTPSPALNTSIVAGGTATVTVPVTLNDSGTNQDACQTVTPDIKLSVS